MTKKEYVCSECGHVFPEELKTFIESGTQVYCEKCGSAFRLDGRTFKEPAAISEDNFKKYQKRPLQYRRRQHRHVSHSTKSLDNIIQGLNQVSYIPILIISIISFAFIGEIAIYPSQILQILTSHLAFGIAGILIVLYDVKYISPKIKEKKYNEIFLDSFCFGILGAILFGTGAILIIKGIFIFLYVILDSENVRFRTYDFGLLMKNSLNHFSAKAGIVIILITLFGLSTGIININELSPLPPMNSSGPMMSFNISALFNITLIVFLILAIVSLIIDWSIKDEIKNKNKFEFVDFIRILIIGIIGSLFSAAGVFIILKGVVIFFLMFGEPTPAAPIKAEIKQPILIPVRPVQEKKPSSNIIIEKNPYKKTHIVPIKPKIEKEEIETPKQFKKKLKLKIHDSLLPIKNAADKELVTEYFTKIFTVFSKDLRKQILKLNVSNDEKKELLKELAFLSAEKQIEYVEGLVNLYKEIPEELIKRIRKLPNVKPKHYGKIIQQLKYMDIEEQITFIQFLEKNA